LPQPVVKKGTHNADKTPNQLLNPITNIQTTNNNTKNKKTDSTSNGIELFLHQVSYKETRRQQNKFSKNTKQTITTLQSLGDKTGEEEIW
jgi:hypothetical protein